MDIFEADEQQREEELQKWWKDNWASIVSGVLVALVAICALYYYREYNVQNKQQSTTDFYTIVMQNDGTDDKSIGIVKDFISTHNDEYGQLASIQLSKSFIAMNKYQEAYDVISQSIKSGSDEILDNLMQLRAARLAIELKKFDKAMDHLNSVKNDSFTAAVAELKGDLLRAQGNFSDALDSYKKAMDLAVDTNVSAILKMKYDSLLTTDGVVSKDIKTSVETVDKTKTENKDLVTDDKNHSDK